jgi:hypothetical protein
VILVDTSVLIDYLNGTENTKTDIFDSVLKEKLPYSIASYSFQEVLQGAGNEREYESINQYFSTQSILFLPEETATYEKAARMYYELRRQGLTPGSTVGIFIALIAIENNIPLLHNDRDFDLFASRIEGLRIYE